MEVQTGTWLENWLIVPVYLVKKDQKSVPRWGQRGPTTDLVTLHRLPLLAFGRECDLVWQKVQNSTRTSRMVHIVKKNNLKDFQLMSLLWLFFFFYRKKSIGPKVRQTILGLWHILKNRGGKNGGIQMGVKRREGWEGRRQMKSEACLVLICWERLWVSVICDQNCLITISEGLHVCWICVSMY